VTDLAALAERWRGRAAELRRYAPDVANAFEDAAAEMEAFLTAVTNELLGLRAAAQESGYTVDHLRRLIREGQIANAGRPHSPRIRRGDLPRKTVGLGAVTDRRHLSGSPTQIARAVIASEGGR
jgi:hypothetical protein